MYPIHSFVYHFFSICAAVYFSTTPFSHLIVCQRRINLKKKNSLMYVRQSVFTDFQSYIQSKVTLLLECVNPSSLTNTDTQRDSEQRPIPFNCIFSWRVICLCIPDSKSHLSIRSNSLSEPMLDSNTSLLLWANYSSNPPLSQKNNLHMNFSASYSFPFIFIVQKWWFSLSLKWQILFCLPLKKKRGNVEKECLCSLFSG